MKDITKGMNGAAAYFEIVDMINGAIASGGKRRSAGSIPVGTLVNLCYNRVPRNSRILETLNIRTVDNVALGGDLIEINRGSERVHRLLGTCNTEDAVHFFHENHRFGGNHYHKDKIEVMTVLSGDIDVYLENPVTREYGHASVPANHKFTLVPGIAHALYKPRKFLTDEVQTIVFEQANLVFNPVNPRNDVISFPIIDPKTGYTV